MNNIELLYAKREIEGFEVFGALCAAETLADDDEDIKELTMRILFDDKFSELNKLVMELQKEKLNPLLKTVKHFTDKEQES